MLKSLEKLRDGIKITINVSPDEITSEALRQIADEIQAEVDEKYAPRDAVKLTAWGLKMESLVGLKAVLDTEEILKKYGTLDAYIDKFYLPRPLFEDGEPVQFGDKIDVCGYSVPVEYIHYEDNGYVEVGRHHGGSDRLKLEDGRLSHSPEPDTQEKIDADYRNETNSLITDSGRGCMTRERALKYVEKFDELMARQRKLDGVED